MHERIKQTILTVLLILTCVQILAVPRQAQAIPVAIIEEGVVAIAGWVATIGKVAKEYAWDPLVEGFPGSSIVSKTSCSIFVTTKGTIGAILTPPGLDAGATQELLGNAIQKIIQQTGEEGIAQAGTNAVSSTPDSNALLGCISAHTSIIAEKAVKNDVRNNLLKVISRAVIRMVIQEMKRSIINYILTGNLEGPTFVTSFIGDPALAAENAVRGYLSQVSGINFCSFFPPVIPSVYSFSFNFQLQCMLGRSPKEYAKQNLINAFKVTPLDRIALAQPQNNYTQVMANLLQGKSQAAAESIIALMADATVGSGYLSIKSPRFGSQTQVEVKEVVTGTQSQLDCEEGAADCGVTDVQTTEKVYNVTQIPGKTLGDMVEGALDQTFQGLNVAREIDDALVEIATITVGKLVNDGLNGLFGSRR